MTPDTPSDPLPEFPRPADCAVDAPDDEQLFCPACTYNLTGLTTSRCPECGSLYDLDALRAIRDGEITHTMPWELTDQLAFRQRLLYTVYVSTGQPVPFCRSFGFVPRQTRAATFFAFCLAGVSLTVAAAGVIAALVDTGLSGSAQLPSLRRYITLPALYAFFVVLWQTLAAAAFLTFLVPHRDGRCHFWPWWTMLRYAASHFLLLPPFVLVGIVLGAAYELPALLGAYALLAIGYFGCTLLWAFTIGHLVRVRGERSRAFAWLLFFLLTFGSVALAALTIFALEMVVVVLQLLFIRFR